MPATGLNEWPVPSARTRALRDTRRASAATETGRCTRRALNVMLPAQFVMPLTWIRVLAP